MKRFLPYFLIAVVFAIFIVIFHRDSLSYRFNPTLVHDYLRSQDIEDPQGLIKDRVIMSDSDTYQATGYLYATGTDPSKYNFQHPPLVKYLFGVSTLLTGNPLYIQIIFGFAFLCLTYFLGRKLKLGNLGYLGVLGLLIDPLFGGMMNQSLLDLGQAVFALGYVILAIFFPENFILQGIVLGLFAASKFWSTAIIFVILVWGFRVFIEKEKINLKKTILSFIIVFVVFALTYFKSFIDAKGMFNIFFFLAKEFKYILAHDSAGYFGGSILLFLKTNVFWALGLGAGVFGVFGELRKKAKSPKFFIYLLPFIYLLSLGSAIPFSRYFLIILPFIYLNFASLIAEWYHWRK